MLGTGFSVKTSDSVIGTSGTAKVIYGVNLVSGASASTIKLYDGTSSSGTLVAQFTGSSGIAQDFSLGINGVTFPNGCFLDVDANTVTATVFYREVK